MSNKLANVDKEVNQLLDIYNSFTEDDRDGMGIVLNETIPYMQILNPQNNDHFGLGILKDIADDNGFTPNEDWKLVTHKFSSTGGFDKKEMYVTTKPRLLILNFDPKMWLRSNGQTTEKSVYSDAGIPKGWSVFRYCVVLPLDANNQPMASTPFRINLGRTAGKVFVKEYQNFVVDMKKAFSTFTGRKIKDSDFNKTTTNLVYCPTFDLGVATNKDGESSEYAEVVDYLTPESIKDYVSLVIPPNNPLNEDIKIMVMDTKDWILPPKKAVNSTQYTDYQESAAYIMPNDNNGSSYVEITNSTPIPF